MAGSAIQAFEEVCPERIDLIHKNYRKLCNLLVDVEEWGQVVIINMLTRYIRTQFINPNEEEVILNGKIRSIKITKWQHVFKIGWKTAVRQRDKIIYKF